MGAIILQGPHHSAEKSTSTGLGDCIISLKVIVLIFVHLFNSFHSKPVPSSHLANKQN
jgi:hypothetical protein